MNPKPCSMLCWLAALALTLGLLAACGGDDAPADATVRQSIGAAGGSLRSADGKMSLTIPAGALGNDTEIAITEVSPDNQSDAVRQLGADKVYRLEPSGLAFAQAVSYEVSLPPSSTGGVVAALLYSGGIWEWVADQSMTVSAVERKLSGQLNHFSELALKDSGVGHGFDVQPRELAPGARLQAMLTVQKAADTVAIELYGLGTFGDDPFIDAPAVRDGGLANVVEEETAPLSLPKGSATASGSSLYECLKPHEHWIRFGFRVGFIDGSLWGVVVDQFDKVISVSSKIPYVCKAEESPSPPGGAIRTGLFPLPLGMQQPDGLSLLVRRAFAALPGNTVHALIAGSNGAVGIDLKTGQVSMNQTAGGPDGQLGASALLGVTPVSQPNPGPQTHAALFGAGALGSAVRSFVQFNNGAWGWSQILLLGQALQWTTSGGGLEADEVLGVRPGLGLVANRFDGVAYRQSAEGSVDAFRFDGKLAAAAVPLNLAGSPLLVSTHTDGDTTTSVWHHDRSRTPGTLLFKVPGVAKVLRCMDQALSAALGSRRLCGLTTDDALFYWQYDTLDPAAAPTVASQAVGPGAVGLDISLDANGKPWAVVSNFGSDSVSLFRFDHAGGVVDRQAVRLPAGCAAPAHAVPFHDGGSNYIVGTCYGSDQYYVHKFE